MLNIVTTTAEKVMTDPAFPVLAEEYRYECAALNVFSDFDQRLAMYRVLDDSGMYHALAAYDDDELIGFAAVIIPVIPHYGKMIATMESLFVRPGKRKGGAGIFLIREAERIAREARAPALFVSAPACGRLEKILPAFGYHHSNTVYVRAF